MLPELKTNWENSGRLHTEKAVSEKEVCIEVERVVVCHGLGDVEVSHSGDFGERGACELFLVWNSWSVPPPPL